MQKKFISVARTEARTKAQKRKRKALQRYKNYGDRFSRLIGNKQGDQSAVIIEHYFQQLSLADLALNTKHFSGSRLTQ